MTFREMVSKLVMYNGGTRDDAAGKLEAAGVLELLAEIERIERERDEAWEEIRELRVLLASERRQPDLITGSVK